MSIQADLHALDADLMTQVPAAFVAAISRADIALGASRNLDAALQAGDRAPDFALAAARGGVVRLAHALASGPVVLSFYRGAWCPYCNLELRALQKVLPELGAVGATLFAVSPQTPEESLSTADMNGLAFPVLSDTGARVAKSFGLAFSLADDLRPVFTNAGRALPDRNGDDSWVLPVPATYVIDRDGIIAFAHVDVDFRHRLEPATITSTLAALAPTRFPRGVHHV